MRREMSDQPSEHVRSRLDEYHVRRAVHVSGEWRQLGKRRRNSTGASMIFGEASDVVLQGVGARGGQNACLT
jgi:hypothetical protein